MQNQPSKPIFVNQIKITQIKQPNNVKFKKIVVATFFEILIKLLKK